MGVNNQRMQRMIRCQDPAMGSVDFGGADWRRNN